MGDRSNIRIDMGDEDFVYLYGHWMGNESITHALVGAKSGRLGDPAYLARIIFSSMIANELGSELGYGIATYKPDNEYPVIVFSETGTVGFEGSDIRVSANRFIELAEQVLNDGKNEYKQLDRLAKLINKEEI